jgi:hypothetical protein
MLGLYLAFDYQSECHHLNNFVESFIKKPWTKGLIRAIGQG